MSSIPLEALARKLQDLYSLVLKAERDFQPSLGGLPLLDQLINDPAWAEGAFEGCHRRADHRASCRAS